MFSPKHILCSNVGMLSIDQSNFCDSFGNEITHPNQSDQVDNSHDVNIHATGSEFSISVEESSAYLSTKKRLKRKRVEKYDIQDSMDSLDMPEEPISDSNNQSSPRSKHRANLTLEKLAELREKEKIRRRMQRASMTDEQRAQQREINRQREAAYRARFTDEQRMKQREIDRQRQAAFRAALSNDERMKQKEIDRLRKATSRARKRIDQGDQLPLESPEEVRENVTTVVEAAMDSQITRNYHWTDTDSNSSAE